MLRFLDAGESHGKALVAILEGVPSNIKINIDNINYELSRRQKGYGRGNRMKIEKDRVEIWSGLRGGFTTGNPITLVIFNKDYDNWQNTIHDEPEGTEKIGIARPGHGDFVGFMKYKTGDIRNTIERTSARETAIRTAVGAICKEVLQFLHIDIRSRVKSIGHIIDKEVDIFDDTIYRVIEESELRVFDKEVESKAKRVIDKLTLEGDTIGGRVKVEVRGLPIGIGSYSHYDRKLDGILAQGIMSIQGIKALEFGNIIDSSMIGSSFHDEMYLNNGTVCRNTNNSGGIDAGISNGNNIAITAYMKPIPTVRKNLKTVNLITRQNTTTRYERSDVCAVVPVSIVIENIVAFEILKEVLKVYPGDEFNTLLKYIEEDRK
ncbi:chorismate synthase [Clostridium sp. UBA4548]|uniref:chorismate synthase n=1 Tax=Clostridium sp. UBA4548 TaxID=1946361 RepID=UPI0025BBD941|nr:chorismate synthase [Clostridium sp. UBA4548]